MPYKRTATLVISLGLLLSTTVAHGHQTGDSTGSTPSKAVLDISFGQSQLFIKPTQRELAQDKDVQRLPTTSALFLAEWLFTDRWSLMSAFTLPLATQQILVDGDLYHEKAAPTASLGLRWAPWAVDILEDTRLETHLAGLMGTSIGSQLGDIIFPTLGGRIVLTRIDGFNLYAGSTWSFRRDTLALIYGIGNRF